VLLCPLLVVVELVLVLLVLVAKGGERWKESRERRKRCVNKSYVLPYFH
jgi:hypothetical protein